MTKPASRLRRLALIVVGHARRVLMRKEMSWAEGMEHEVHHIEDDRRALGWALGCTFASYKEAFALDASVTYGINLLLLAAIFYFSYRPV